MAFGFGLFHGFGFASLLSGLGLDRTNRVVSLLGFNIGIELGQIAIILLLFPALFMLRRTRIYLPIMRWGSVALIVIAVGWFIDRTLGLDIGVDRVVEPLVAWPRPLYIAAALTVFAVTWYLIERQSNRLIPLDEPEVDVPESREPASV